MDMETLSERWYNNRLRGCEKEGVAREIIHLRYPEFSFVGKPFRQLLAIAGSIVKKWEWENCVEKRTEPSHNIHP